MPELIFYILFIGSILIGIVYTLPLFLLILFAGWVASKRTAGDTGLAFVLPFTMSFLSIPVLILTVILSIFFPITTAFWLVFKWSNIVLGILLAIYIPAMLVIVYQESRLRK